MSSKNVFVIVLCVAALVALAFAWPHLAAMQRKPRVGDWVPAEDPGTAVTVTQSGVRFQAAIGRDHFAFDLFDANGAGMTGVDAFVYAERDGVLGEKGEDVQGRANVSMASPQSRWGMASGTGYRSGGHLCARFTFDDGFVAKVAAGPPIDLQPGVETDWRTLAIVWDLGVLVEWKQTKEHLLVRRSGLPGGPTPAWAGGTFAVNEKACQFVEDTQVARMFRTRVPELGPGECNVTVKVVARDDGVAVDVLAK